MPEEARAELVVGLGVPEEVKAELTIRLRVLEESKSSSGIMKRDVIDYIDVLDYSDYIVYVCRQEAFETGATIVEFILDGCVLSR